MDPACSNSKIAKKNQNETALLKHIISWGEKWQALEIGKKIGMDMNKKSNIITIFTIGFLLKYEPMEDVYIDSYFVVGD